MGFNYRRHSLVIIWSGEFMAKINLDTPDIMDAQKASKIWGHAENYVRLFYQQNPEKFPKGSIRKIGRQWVVTTEGMEAITGIKDPRKRNDN